MAARTSKLRGRSLGFNLLMLAGLLGVAALWWWGRAYYAADLVARLDHPDHARLRASGLIGHGYGIAGTLLILTNLLYLLRKHAGFLRGRGKLRSWMGMHVFAGLVGTGLVLLHSTFQARNDITQAAALSLLILAVTGLVGRYLYGLLPRAADGEELDEATAMARCLELRSKLAEGLREGGEAAPTLQELGLRRPEPHRSNLIMALAELPLLPLQRTRAALRRRRLVHRLAAWPEAAEVADALLRLETSMRTATVFRSFFTWWRALHRAFALVMVLAMLVHVGVAVYYGYTWVF